jgi:cytochrome c oxidase subunit 2
VPLDDGTTVVADTDYLKRSISDPKAQKVAGYTIEMPNLSLPDAEIDQIVTYLEAVGTK